jgi:hypothetical protein
MELLSISRPFEAAQYSARKHKQFDSLVIDLLLTPCPLSLEEGQIVLSFLQKTMKDFELHQDKDVFGVLDELSKNLNYLWDEEYGDEAKLMVKHNLNYLKRLTNNPHP